MTPEPRHLVLNIPAASVDKSFLLQAGYFVLHQQLATLKCHDLKIIDRWMGPCFIKFGFEGPMAFYQFRKMGFHGHVVQFSSVSCADSTYYTGTAEFRRPIFMMHRSNRHRAEREAAQ
jgi:hypothetical protein